MPFYKYCCKFCHKTMLINHSMYEEAKTCLECEAQNSLERIFTESFEVITKDKKEVGKVVDSYIQEAREILKEQKEELKNKGYNEKK